MSKPTRPTRPACTALTKRDGENAVLATGAKAIILRTSWVYAPYGKNFVRTMLNAAQRMPRLRVVADQRGTPTAAPDLARVLLDIQGKISAGGWDDTYRGIFHATGAGETTWHGFALAIFEQAARVGPSRTADRRHQHRRLANACAQAGRRATKPPRSATTRPCNPPSPPPPPPPPAHRPQGRHRSHHSTTSPPHTPLATVATSPAAPPRPPPPRARARQAAAAPRPGANRTTAPHPRAATRANARSGSRLFFFFFFDSSSQTVRGIGYMIEAPDKVAEKPAEQPVERQV